MKRKLLNAALSMIAALLLTAPAFAASFIFDEAGILSPEEAEDLETLAGQIYDDLECGLYIVTVEDSGDINGAGVYEAAKDIYTDSGFGWGDGRDGQLLLLSMSDRQYALAAYGDFANYAFTDYGKERLSEEFLDNFAGDDWYGGFNDFLLESADLLQLAREGAPYDVGSDDGVGRAGGSGSSREGEMSFGVKLLIIIGAPCLIALTVCLILKAQMKTARPQREASAYMTEEGLDLRIRQDVFTHTTETRVTIKSDNNSGGGTSRGRGGFSGRSGGF